MSKAPRNTAKNRHRLIILYFLGLLLAISNAIPAYTQSNFLGQFIGIKMISVVFIIANIFGVISISLFPRFIEKLGNYFVTKIILVVYVTSLLGLAVSSSSVMALISIILFSISSNLVWINMDVFIESLSNNNLTGKIRTTYFTFMNAGWILSPVFATYLIGKGDYTLSFLVAALLIVPFFLIFLHQGKDLKEKIIYQKESLLLTIHRMWHNKNLRSIFFIALLLQLFYASAIIYIPLYLFQNLGMSWKVLGPIFSIMLIPFLLIEIPAGIVADKYWGEKELLFTGFIILILALFSFYYIKEPIAWLWLIVLFFSRVGAALVESMKETYFFKIIDVENVGDINIFRTTGPLAYVLSSALAIIVLIFLPLNYLFLLLAIIMLSGLGFTLAIKDTK